MVAPLSIVVVEPDPDRARLIIDALRDDTNYEIHVVADRASLARRIVQIEPDLVLVDLADPSRDIIEELTLASGPLERPVALFVDRTDTGLSTAAIEAGLSAYVVDGLTQARVKPVLDAAIARFRLMQRMRAELAETKRALEDRKVIDRAKGLLMRARGITEDEAYSLLRKTAMDQGRRLPEVAAALVTAADLLG
ncbi:ANTAR domain-containing protein [Salipiger sp. IMCC34102]|uniref:ANTAR domain-containing response regulator n=1 Tax=Salipiger sp. IMCC34102 TaxID=2510647 RepID=UPI00101D709E|nr:ANTAR domain-containing protein [Salipiger sp. IMCC34102]RYH00907.1 ANTAR domain-containing protein [Salipiger sp. IMCC34102]